MLNLGPLLRIPLLEPFRLLLPLVGVLYQNFSLIIRRRPRSNDICDSIQPCNMCLDAMETVSYSLSFADRKLQLFIRFLFDCVLHEIYDRGFTNWLVGWVVGGGRGRRGDDCTYVSLV